VRPTSPAVASVLAALGLACHTAPGESPRVAKLRRIHADLRERLEERVSRDRFLGTALADRGQVVVAVRTSLLERVVQEIARRYLDEVHLDLDLNARVRAQGEIRVSIKIGKIKAGDWKVELLIHRVRGVLRAGVPRVTLSGANAIGLDVPVTLEQAEGRATIHFSWDSAGLANLVCRNFEIDKTLAGRVAPEKYEVSGRLLLAAGDEAVLARPSFPDARFRLRVDLAPESWAEIRQAIEGQDTFLKCGLGIDPEKIVPKLRELTRKGFVVKLPRSLFRTITVPASISRSVEVLDRTVELSVRPNDLRMETDALWSSASVHSRMHEIPDGS
jgi:hypothetical protein